MNIKNLVSATLLIAGTTVGAGMLGIPLVTGAAGFWPAVVITFLAWFFMLCTGLLFLEAALWLPEGGNILSMSRKFLGFKGKWFAGSTFVFLYYCLMVAYFAAGAPILITWINQIFGISLSGVPGYFVFALIFGSIVAHGVRSIDRVNFLLVVAMVIAYVALIGVGSSEVSVQRLQERNWGFMVGSVPILFSAFGYHNIIPSLCTYLKKDRKTLRLAIFLGTFIPLIVYLSWQWLVIGSVPKEAIADSLLKGQTSAQTLEFVSGNALIPKLAMFFAFFAITTSLLGVAFSMVDFLKDAWHESPISTKRTFLSILTFFPPFLFVSIDPSIFDKALGVAGGFGESILNGLLPITLVWIGRYKKDLATHDALPGGKLTLILLYLAGVFVIILEVKHLLMGRT